MIADAHTVRHQTVKQIMKAGILYFALVFGAGFVLGAIRTLWVVPRIGTRMSEWHRKAQNCPASRVVCPT